MFKSRWRNDRNKIKAVFRLQFQASQIPQLGWEALVVSLVPLDLGKPTVKSEKAVVVDGACCWEEAVFETVRLSRDPKTGNFNKKVYRFVVSATELPKATLLGEVAFDFADCVEWVKPSSVAFPLKASNSGPILHITIQRMQDDADVRDSDQNVVSRQRRTLQSHFSTFNNMDLHTKSNGNPIINSRSFDALSVSESEYGSEWCTPRECGSKADSTNKYQNYYLLPLESTECSLTSAPDGSSDGSTNSLEDTGLTVRLQEPVASSQNLRKEVVSLARQVDVSELELQALRKQVAKERRQGEDLSKELHIVRDERDALRRKYELLKASEINNGIEGINSLQFDGEGLKPLMEEMKHELNHEKNLNAKLHLQVQKTQESNSELILVVKDLQDIVKQKTREMSCIQCSKQFAKQEDNGNSLCTKYENGFSSAHQTENINELYETISEHEEDEELEILAKEQDDVEVECSLEQRIADLNEEIELYKKNQDNIEMQMEQLALDFEIIKQENHDLSLRLEQSQLREQLKTQYECAAHMSIINDLEAQVEDLEKELEKQAEAFEEDLACIITVKVEQEQRAIRAEESLHKTKWNSVTTAERLQEEFKTLAMQMSASFSANEKLAMQALAEADELRLRNRHLEESIGKAKEELSSVKYQYTVQVHELLRQIDSKVDDENQLLLKLKNMSNELEKQKKFDDMSRKALSEEISILKVYIEMLSQENYKLSNQLGRDHNLMGEVEQVRGMEKAMPDLKLAPMRKEAEKSKLSNLRHSKDEKDLEILEMQHENLRAALFEDELEKKKLKEQVLQLRYNLQKKDEAIGILEKKLNDIDARAAATDGSIRTAVPNKNSQYDPTLGSDELAKLQEKIRQLEELKRKVGASAAMKDSYSRKYYLGNDIEKLENGAGEVNQNCPHLSQDSMKLIDSEQEHKCRGLLLQSEMKDTTGMCNNGIEDVPVTSIAASKSTENTSCGNYQKDPKESLRESEVPKQRNESMQTELKEMQKRYSEISLKLAEVESERQQLVMTIRALRNSTKI